MNQLKHAEVGAIKPSGSGLLSSGGGGSAGIMSAPRVGGRPLMGSASTNRSRSRSPIQQSTIGRMGPGLLGPGAPPPPGAIMFAPGQAAASQAPQLGTFPGGFRFIRPGGMSIAGGLAGAVGGGFQIITASGPGGTPQLVATGPGGTAFLLPSGFAAPPGAGNTLLPMQQPPGGLMAMQQPGSIFFSQPPQSTQQPIVIRPQQMQSRHFLNDFYLRGGTHSMLTLG